MARTISFAFADPQEANAALTDLRAQPVNAAGVAVGAQISTGFAQQNGKANWFTWTGDVPDDLTGSVQILTNDGRVLGTYLLVTDRIAAILASVAAVYAAAVAAKTSADAAARAGDQMTLTSGERSAISDRLERAGGPLDTIAAGVGKLVSTLVSAGGGLWRFTVSALQNAPAGGGGGGSATVYVPAPFLLTSSTFPDGAMRVFVGDSFPLTFQLVNGAKQVVPFSGAETFTVQTARAGQIVTAAGAAAVVSGPLGALSYALSSSDTALRGRLTLTVKRAVGASTVTFGPLHVDVVDR